MIQLGEICKSKGLTYGYHNHHYSFVKIDGEYPQDVMMKATAGAPVVYEMDMYWVAAAGEDPKAWFKKYPGQFELGHVKDRYSDAKIKEIMLAEKQTPSSVWMLPVYLEKAVCHLMSCCSLPKKMA